MNRIDDERLVAYADGALDDEQRKEVEVHLETDATARRFVQDLIRSAELVRRAYDAPMSEPPPQRLLDTIMGEPSNVVSLEGSKRTIVSRWLPAALAASLALAIVVVGMNVLDRTSVDGEPVTVALGKVDASSALHGALETAASGEPVTIGDEDAPAQAIPMLTFLDGHARPCREVEVQQASGQALELVIACREPDAHWSVEGVFRIANGGPSTTTGYTPAAGTMDNTSEELLDTLNASEPVSPEEERRLIASGWK